MPLEERPAPTAKNADREQGDMTNRTNRGEQPVAGPSNTSQRQGFCSCCQVLYNSVEQHILSSRHREVVRAARANVSSGSLMERFLQDVLQHHPHRYNDTRPSHADLPCLNTLPVPREVLSEVYCGSEDDGVSVGTREEMPSSEEESCQMAQAEGTSTSRSQHQIVTSLPVPTCSGVVTSAQSGPETRKITMEPPVPEKYSPTQGFLHRTSFMSAIDKPHASSQLAQTAQQESSQTQPNVQPCSSKTLPLTQPGFPQFQHRKAHRKSNRHREGSDSSQGSPTSPTMKCITSKSQPGPSRPPVEEPAVWTSRQPPWKGQHRERTFSEQSDLIRNVIEEVIEQYCYGRNPKPSHDDESSFHLSLKSISESKDSEEWDTLQVAFEKTTTEDKHLACLMKVHVNLEDQEYKTQLNTALNTMLDSEPTVTEEAKELKVEEIIPDLPHIPQSFVGKTWAQVMFEDDLKIDSMVKDFREGCFRCYFDSESLARFGKHRRKGKKSRKREKKATADDAECKDVLPLMEHHEECPEHSPKFKKTRQRIYRMASRCQVVKVSHGTQTVSTSCPVVRRKTLSEAGTFPNDPEPQKDLSPERTPDMKTRLCALKLPASYCRIMTPLQPKTVVYVLSSPDGGQGTFKPTPIKRMGRKRKSSVEECAFKYKYKKTPLKYYDPLTNRILKTPPKGSSTPSTKSLSHVRQLFRSLSPDINKECHSSTRGRSPRGSRKGHGDGSLADLCASTSGSCLDSGGPSEPDSSMSSSRRALFNRSSISSSSRFLLRHLMPSASHTDSSSRTQVPSHADSSHKVAGTNLEDDNQQIQVDHPPVRRRSQRQGVKEKPLTPARKPSSPPYRTKRKSGKARSRVKSSSTLQRKVSTRVAAGDRVSPRSKISTRASPRLSASSKLAV